MVSRKMGAMIKRVLAAAVMIPIAIITLYIGSPFVEVLAITVGGFLAWEWANMLSTPHTSSYYVTAYMMALATAIWAYNFAVILPMIAIISLFVWALAEKEKHRWLIVLGVPYIAIGVASLIWMYRSFDPSAGDFDPRYNYSFIMSAWFFLMVWSMDIGGLVVGCNVRGPKLAPKISPNKTWSGLLGAMLFSALISAAFAHFTEPTWMIRMAAVGAVLAIVAQCGDLLESKVKRYLQVKDSSNLIPGHGGMFDRVDGLLFSAPFVLVLCVVLVYYMAR